MLAAADDNIENVTRTTLIEICSFLLTVPQIYVDNGLRNGTNARKYQDVDQVNKVCKAFR